MSKSCNTDGMYCFPDPGNVPITLNALESIECAIAFSVREWGDCRRDAWIYAIIFGWDDEWEEMAEKHGWDEEDRKRAEMMHEQWKKAKEMMKRDA